MRCNGYYLFKRDKMVCERRWSCRNYAFRNKPPRETAKSEWQLCDKYEETIQST